MKAADKHVHVSVLLKLRPKMWTSTRRHRLSACSPYSVGNAASSRLEFQPSSLLSVQSSPDRAVASAPPFAEVAPAAPTVDSDLGGPAVGAASAPPLAAVADAAGTDSH